MTYIDIINESTQFSAAELEALVPVLEKQINRDLVPIWHVDTVSLKIVKADPTAPVLPAHDPSDWWLVFLDTADQAGALGYHDLTKDGYPMGKVFVKTTKDAGDLVSVTASHELMEMIVDPEIDTVVDVNGDGTEFMMMEVGDAVEDDRFAYTIDGVTVSDFVTPNWFRAFALTPNAKFDFLGHVSKPLELLVGGYIGVYKSSTGWTQQTNFALDTGLRKSSRIIPNAGSRRHRKMIPRGDWQKSTVKF